MHALEPNYLVLVFGAFPILWAALMVYVHWIRPGSSLRPAFGARWRGGRQASQRGAAAQVFAFAAGGILLVILGLGAGELVKHWMYVVYAAAAAFTVAFYVEA